MTRALPPAAVLVMKDALTEAKAAGITDPAAAAQHAASALVAHGWYLSAQPAHLTAHNPTESPWTT